MHTRPPARREQRQRRLAGQSLRYLDGTEGQRRTSCARGTFFFVVRRVRSAVLLGKVSPRQMLDRAMDRVYKQPMRK